MVIIMTVSQTLDLTNTNASVTIKISSEISQNHVYISACGLIAHIVW